MDILSKLIVAIAFFVTLVLSAIWAQDKLDELDEYWREDDEDSES